MGRSDSGDPICPPHPILFQSIPFLPSPSSYVLLAPLFLFQPFQSLPSRPGASPGFPAQDRSGTSPGPPRCIPAWGCMGKGSGRGLAWAGSVAGPGAGPGPTHARIHFYSTQDASASGNRKYPSCEEFIMDNPDQGLRMLTPDECKSFLHPMKEYYRCEFCRVANLSRGTAKILVQRIENSPKHREMALDNMRKRLQ